MRGRLLLISAMAVATLTPAPAVAATAPERAPAAVSAHGALLANRILTLQNRFTRACLDDSFEYGLRGFPCNGFDFQRWNTILRGDASWTVTNLATGRCLDHSDEYGLRSIVCNGNAHQEWIILDTGGALELRNRKTRLCLDDSQVGVRGFPCNSLDYQRWNFW
ncbi:RICIN domain-containing protein [Spirillospora sp. NPDC047279]|uniref:RICIN domain-containing protein n=1 Tax=Spirillospora sp. NPDC047279 TaxID=3155478 RepID=UPI0033EE90AE